MPLHFSTYLDKIYCLLVGCLQSQPNRIYDRPGTSLSASNQEYRIHAVASTSSADAIMSRCIESNNMEQLQYDGSLPRGNCFRKINQRRIHFVFCSKLFAEHSMALRALFLSMYIFLRNIIKSKCSKDQHNTAISVIYDSPIMHDFLGKHQTSKVLTSMKKYKSTHGKLSSSSSI